MSPDRSKLRSAGKRLFASGADATAQQLVEPRQTGAVAILTLAAAT